jgi:hypothetical protein
MKTRLSYSLALLCGLTLVLPAGWCCILLPVPAGTQERGSCDTAHDCCGGDRDPSEPAPHDPDAPPCPCSDRHTTLPSFELPADELPAVMPLLPAPVSATGPVAAILADLSLEPLFRPLQVLQCVWRC